MCRLHRGRHRRGRGLVGWRALGAAGSGSALSGGALAVEVESGFVGATSWRGDMLTLRPAAGGGMVLRAELDGTEHVVDVSEGFAGRCVGTVGDVVAVCGHRVIETGRTTFETGIDYKTLIADAGPLSELLLGQPVFPEVAGYTHVLVERFPSLLASRDLAEWDYFDLPLVDGRGGSFGAVLGRGGVLAADRYAIAEVPDSVFETTLVSLADATEGEVSVARDPIPVDHGSLWGGGDDGTSDLVIISDRDGTTGYDSRGGAVFSITDGSELLGANPEADSLGVTVQTASGRREVRRYRDGVHTDTTVLADDSLIRHRIAPDITIAAPDGQHSLVPNSQIARPKHTRR